ncbi:MAG: ABC transporter substrate-binding protein [Ruminococcaceae bacterium]|nr:ABC transporter substrate-binding protein [Oscillospiraceae bacterium]
MLLREVAHLKRFCFLLACMLACSFLFASCAPNSNAPSSETRTVTDGIGRCVSVPKEGLRVASLLGSFADIWYLSGGTLVAAAEDAWEDFSLPLEGAVNLGGAHSPSLEAVFSSGANLVLASASTASHVALEEALTAAGIAVLYFDLNSFDDYLSMLRTCTEITGREDLYEENGIAQKERIDAVLAEYRALSLTDAERKVLFLRASSGSVKAKGSEGTVLGEMLFDFGCINIADGGALDDLSIEKIILDEPHHIFTVSMGKDETAAKASLDRMMAENPAWSTLDAIEEGRFHVMDRSLFHLKPNARWGDAYEALFDLLTAQ